jgi:hypothetical protein
VAVRGIGSRRRTRRRHLTLVQTAKLNDVAPQAWLADVPVRIADHEIDDLAVLLPRNWHPTRIERVA